MERLPPHRHQRRCAPVAEGEEVAAAVDLPAEEERHQLELGEGDVDLLHRQPPVGAGDRVGGEVGDHRRAATTAVSARSPSRSVSSGRTSSIAMLPRFTSEPRWLMNQACWAFRGASKMTCSRPSREARMSTRSSRTEPSAWYS